jgi:hypothetical protein
MIRLYLLSTTALPSLLGSAAMQRWRHQAPVSGLGQVVRPTGEYVPDPVVDAWLDRPAVKAHFKGWTT